MRRAHTRAQWLTASSKSGRALAGGESGVCAGAALTHAGRAPPERRDRDERENEKRKRRREAGVIGHDADDRRTHDESGVAEGERRGEGGAWRIDPSGGAEEERHCVRDAEPAQSEADDRRDRLSGQEY